MHGGYLAWALRSKPVNVQFALSAQGITRYGLSSAGLAQELLTKILSCSPTFFEQWVVELLVKMGYGSSRKDAGERIGQSGDGGIEGIMKEDQPHATLP